MIPLVLSIWSADRPQWNASTVGPDPTTPLLGRSGEDGGEQFGRGRAGYLGRGRRAGRRADDQIGLGHIQPGIEEAGDDTDQPRISCRSAATENQRSLTRGAYPTCSVDLRLILAGPRQVGWLRNQSAAGVIGRRPVKLSSLMAQRCRC